MFEIKFTIPDDKKDELIDAFCDIKGYDPALGTKSAFAKEQIKLYIKDTYLRWKLNKARSEATKDLDTKINIT